MSQPRTSHGNAGAPAGIRFLQALPSGRKQVFTIYIYRWGVLLVVGPRLPLIISSMLALPLAGTQQSAAQEMRVGIRSNTVSTHEDVSHLVSVSQEVEDGEI